MKFKFVIFSLFILLCLLPGKSLATGNDPRQDACEFVSLLVNKNGEAGIEKIAQMFFWNEDIAKQATNAMSALKNYEYAAGNAYLVGDFGGLSEQYLIVMGTKENGSIYFHLSFEKLKEDLVLLNINFQDNYKNLLDAVGPFPLPPKQIPC